MRSEYLKVNENLRVGAEVVPVRGSCSTIRVDGRHAVIQTLRVMGNDDTCKKKSH